MKQQKKSLRKAINENCRDCIYDPEVAGSAATQIELCSAYRCKMWVVRPVRSVANRELVGYTESVREYFNLSDEQIQARLADPFDKDKLERLDVVQKKS